MATTTTTFDIAALKQALESLDLDALREIYADDVEHLSIDEKTPPSAPGVRNKERIMSAFEHCKGADGRITVENEFAGEDRAAATLTCSFPSGFRVMTNSIFFLREGKITREIDIQAFDPPASSE